MDHPDTEICFFDLSDLSLDDQKWLQKVLSPLNRTNVGVKLPWDGDSYEDEKHDENGNSISQPELPVSCQQQPVTFHIPPGINAGVIVQPNIVQMPVVSDGMSIHSNGMAHVYPAAHPFVGYSAVNPHEIILPPQPIQLGPPPASGMAQQNLTTQPLEIISPSDDLENCLPSGKQALDEAIPSQPNVHHMPFSNIPQAFSAQSGPALFYSPTGPQAAPTRGQTVFYIPVPYPPPGPASYPVYPTPSGAMPVNPCVLTSENVEVTEIEMDSNHKSDTEYDKNEHFNSDKESDSKVKIADDKNHVNSQSDEDSRTSNDNSVNYSEFKTETQPELENNITVCPERTDETTTEQHDVSTDSETKNIANDTSESETSVDLSSQNNAWSKPKSWASLFTKNMPNDSLHSDNKLSLNSVEFEANGVKSDDDFDNSASCDNDKLSGKIGSSLSRFKIVSKSVHILPRGLVNKSNWCYINATLQALLVCPPFYNLMKELPIVPGHKRRCSSTPILDNLVEFVDNFMNIQLNNNKNKRKDELSVGQPFEPNSVYRMLSGIGSSCVKGRQEDAEEFLSCILDGIHEEMVAVVKNRNDKFSSDDALQNGISFNGDAEMKVNGTSSDDDWLVIKGKNKGIITRSANYVKSPISEIFGGQLRSVLRKSGTDPSANLEPFFTLQLDVQSNQVCSIKDALHSLVSKESVEGCICAKTGAEVEASRRLTLEELPSVLILHIKRFVYNKDGGCQKVLKQIEYDMDLDLSIDLLSSEVKIKYKKMRSYKLFAVVYHDGKEAVKGHYITDAYHSGSNGWLRFDDSSVYRISENQVLKHCPPRVPYLLFYKRQLYNVK